MKSYDLSSVIFEFDCEYCGKHDAFTCLRRDYKYKSGSPYGMRYFCSESCKRKFLAESKEKYKKRRWKEKYYDEQ